MVQEIEALWKKLNATEDEDEQRALEEDVTGKARTASTSYLWTLMVHLLIDLVVLLAWDLRRSGGAITKGKPTLSIP
ncbi:hypothetical protein M404DRAFT_1003994, partial [Pisolithus tinctorius Marx 270]